MNPRKFLKQLLKFACSLCLTLTQGLAMASPLHTSAVILQYHNVSTETPASTSVTPEQLEAHIRWLKAHDFTLVPLSEVVNHLAGKTPFPEANTVAITFDDAHRSVCENAWPILRKYRVPFTLFIHTAPIEAGYPSQCRWDQLKTMVDSGLMTPANHSHHHPHLATLPPLPEETILDEIDVAQSLIEARLGEAPRWFAYPYGEFNQRIQELLQRKGFYGFGQHSGAAGLYTNLQDIPRFPASGTYASLDTLPDKLYSLALPAQVIDAPDNPIPADSHHNPPVLKLELKEPLPHPVVCYSGEGEPILVHRHGNLLEITRQAPMPAGRHRFNCTSNSGQPRPDGKPRYYWFSYQWLVSDTSITSSE